MSTERRGLALALALAAAALPVLASAQEELDPAAADLFHRGRKLIKEGDWKEGCASLDASLKRSAAVSTMLNVALCREHEGRVATAWVLIQRALVLNQETVGEQRRGKLAASAQELLRKIEPRLARVRVTVVPSVDGASVAEDGRALPLDTPVPLDPGPHELVLSAPGRAEARRKVELREGEVLAVELSFPAPTYAPAPVPSSAADDTPAGAPAPARAPQAHDGHVDARGVPAWVWITGAAGTIVGGVAVGFGVDAANATSSLEERCGADLICDEDPTFDPGPDNARRDRGLGLALGLGGAALAAMTASAIGLGLALAEPDRPAETSLHASGWATPDAAGLGMSGTF